MITKIKKFLIPLFIFILAASQVFAFDVPITKENLTEAFNLYAKGYTGVSMNEDGTPHFNTISPSIPIEVTDTQLIDYNNDTTYYIDYSLDDNPTFSTKFEINSETNLDTLVDLNESLRSPCVGLIGVGMVQGLSIIDAWKYSFSAELAINPEKENINVLGSLGDNQFIIRTDEEEKVFLQDDFDVTDLVTSIYEDEKVITDDEYGLYTYTVTATQNSSDSYTIEAKLEIDKDADFSKIGSLNNNADNNNDNNNNDNNNNDNNNNNNNNNNSNINNNNSTPTKDNTVSYNRLPKAGITTITFALIISIILVIIFGIKNQKYKGIK